MILWYNIMLCSESYIILFSKYWTIRANLVGNISVLDGLSRSLTTLSRVHWMIHTYNEHTCMYVRHDNVYCECHYGLWFCTVPYYVQCGTGLSTGFSGSSATEYAVLYSSHRRSHNNCNGTAWTPVIRSYHMNSLSQCWALTAAIYCQHTATQTWAS